MRLRQAHGLAESQCQIVAIKTSGDRIRDRSLADIGGKGLFTKEIEEALLAGDVDLAVHSMKDMQTSLPAGLIIGAVLPREDVRDAFISARYRSLDELPAGAVVGTSSLRRQAQAKRARPDIRVVPMRGNVETRLNKIRNGDADATFLAAAGLNRLGLSASVASFLSTEQMLPAVAQAAIGVEMRAGDKDLAALLAPLDHAASALCVRAERAFLARLEGSCRTPIAGLAEVAGTAIRFRGMILAPDGTQSFETERTGPAASAERLAQEAADELLARAGSDFFRALL